MIEPKTAHIPPQSAVYYLNLVLALFEVDGAPQHYPAGLLDLTTWGAKLLTSKPLKEGSKITLQVDLPGNAFFRVHGVVKWSKSIAAMTKLNLELSNYLHSIEFQEVAPETGKLIFDHVYARLVEELGEVESAEEEPDYLQHRRYIRAPLTVSVFCKDAQNTPFSITTEDLSSAGMKFASQRPLNKGDLLSLEIQFDISEPVVPAKGRVIWMKKTNDSEFEGGLEFTEMSPEARKTVIVKLSEILSLGG